MLALKADARQQQQQQQQQQQKKKEQAMRLQQEHLMMMQQHPQSIFGRTTDLGFSRGSFGNLDLDHQASSSSGRGVGTSSSSSYLNNPNFDSGLDVKPPSSQQKQTSSIEGL